MATNKLFRKMRSLVENYVTNNPTGFPPYWRCSVGALFDIIPMPEFEKLPDGNYLWVAGTSNYPPFGIIHGVIDQTVFPDDKLPKNVAELYTTEGLITPVFIARINTREISSENRRDA